MYDEDFARVYDALMAEDFDYPAWAAHYLRLADLPKTVCECGCGTGSMTVALARAGVRVTGVDLSPAMLRVASAKARAHGVSIPFVCQDMCDLTLPRPVDAIFCPCDGVNYLLDDARVLAFFTRARAFLKPGGALVFDVSTPRKLLAMDGAPYYEDAPELTYFWRNRVEGALVHMELTFFERRAGGLYARFDEAQTQRAHSMQTLTDLLVRAGYCDIRVLGDYTEDAPTADAMRWHVAARCERREST